MNSSTKENFPENHTQPKGRGKRWVSEREYGNSKEMKFIKKFFKKIHSIRIARQNRNIEQISQSTVGITNFLFFSSSCAHSFNQQPNDFSFEKKTMFIMRIGLRMKNKKLPTQGGFLLSYYDFKRSMEIQRYNDL